MSPYDDYYDAQWAVCGVCMIVGIVAVWFLCMYNFIIWHNKKYAGKIEEQRKQEELLIEVEYMEAVQSQKRTEPWAKRYETSPCPYCGHYKVRNATWDDKRMSVAFWGAASNAIGKDYICDRCKHMW